ncbi:MAG TPA: YMGG-like glycine zipper-containing protein [Pyrinomonadaceae bacterium]|nr:YMGG-like glycine zipper-containing protein [Pyrinomonadaceae bacterium]
MYRIRPVVVLLAVIALLSVAVPGQQQRRSSTAGDRAAASTQSRLTGIYRLDAESSDDPQIAAARVAGSLPPDEQRRVVEALSQRLESPEQLAIERRGLVIDIASSRSPRISFEADDRERREQAADGHTITTRAVLYGDQLMVIATGSPDDEFTVTFDPLDNGRRLRVTRRIYSQDINQHVVVQSIYDKTSTVARWGIFDSEPRTATQTARNNPQRRFPQPSPPNTTSNRPQNTPPVIRERAPQQQLPPPPAERNDTDAYALVIPAETQFVAVLEDDLSTARSREGDPFRMTVRAPAQFEGATLEGFVSRVNRGGRLSGRPEMAFEFRQIRLRDGRTAPFDAYVESLHTTTGEDVRVNSEASGTVQEGSGQTNRTAQRAAIGAAIGAILGAIADGGKGAAIGAAVGAGVGAGSVYAQGRDDLELLRGTELIIRARATR